MIILFNKTNKVSRKSRSFVGFVEGAQYRLIKNHSNKKQGIAGKICTILKPQNENKESFWVKVEDDIYYVSKTDIDPNIVWGRYKVNYLDVVSSELFKDIEVTTGTFQVDSLPKIEGLNLNGFPYKDVRYFRIKYGNDVFVNLGEVPFIKNKNRYLFATSPDLHDVIEEFKTLSGKNLWHIVKTLVYLELPLCRCGSTYQIWEELDFEFVVSLLCGGCNRLLFYASNTIIVKAEPKIEKIYEENVGR